LVDKLRHCRQHAVQQAARQIHNKSKQVEFRPQTPQEAVLL